MVSDLVTTLATETGYSWAAWGWSKPPSGDYGVVSGTADDTFQADERNSERVRRGFVDYFTRSDGETAKATIEAALNKSGVQWWNTGLDYEQETGFLHLSYSVVWW